MKQNLKANGYKFIIQGFSLAGAMAIADPSAVLPLIVNYFGGNNLLVGIFSSLLRGGAILMQLYAAFYAQSYGHVLKHMRRVFLFRFIAWFSLGAIIFFLSPINHQLTLIIFGIGLFFFSFSAGFGAVYYQELMGKSFTKEYRGRLIAKKQLFSGLAGIVSGGISAYILETFSKPDSFALLFLTSSVIMGLGFLYMSTFSESEKKNTTPKESSFSKFLVNSTRLLKTDRFLRIQINSRLISYSFWLILPFIILEAKHNFGISGQVVGTIVALQMFGSMLGNLIWGKLSASNKNRRIILISFILMIAAISLAIIAKSIYYYYFLFLLTGAAIDGFRLSYSNLILIIAPEEKRPVYIAVQNNFTSLGLFLSIPGGALLDWLGFNYLAFITIFLMVYGFFITFRLKCI